MKVRQDPPAHPGYNGKQGGERFRTILKYPAATDMAMKRYRVNDTSLRSWRGPGRGEIPMDLSRKQASDVFPFACGVSRTNNMQRPKPKRKMLLGFGGSI